MCSALTVGIMYLIRDHTATYIQYIGILLDSTTALFFQLSSMLEEEMVKLFIVKGPNEQVSLHTILIVILYYY